MKILVTGGAGFIGSHIVESFQGRAEVVVLDNFRSGHSRNLEGLDCQLIEGDITSAPDVEAAMRGVDYVFHMAALVSVPESMQMPEECQRINVLGLLNVLKTAAAARSKKLVFASSAAIYGNNPTSPKSESLLPEPLSPYAITKLDGEYYCGLFQREGWLSTACLRFFNVFGPRQDPASPYAAAVPIFLEKARRGDPLIIHGDGEQTRDFVYVKDIVLGLEHCALNESVCGVFNCGYGKSLSINDLVRTILDRTKSSSECTYSPTRPGDVRHSCTDVSKLLSTGWSPRFGWELGIEETLTSEVR